MKPINLINALSPQQQTAIHTWYRTSCILIAATIASAVIILVPSIHNLYHAYHALQSCQNKNTQSSDILTTNTTLKKEQERIQAQLNIIHAYTKGTKNPRAQFIAVLNKCTDDIHLEYIKKHKKNYEISCICTQPQQATHFIQALRDTQQFTKLQLVSLHHNSHDKTVRCIIKGQ